MLYYIILFIILSILFLYNKDNFNDNIKCSKACFKHTDKISCINDFDMCVVSNDSLPINNDCKWSEIKQNCYY
jgi:hypothetical protein